MRGREVQEGRQRGIRGAAEGYRRGGRGVQTGGAAEGYRQEGRQRGTGGAAEGKGHWKPEDQLIRKKSRG